MTDITTEEKEELVEVLKYGKFWTIQRYVINLRRIYGSSGLFPDEIKMPRGTFSMERRHRDPDDPRPNFYFRFHTALAKRRWNRSKYDLEDDDTEVHFHADNLEELLATLKKMNQKPRGKVPKSRPNPYRGEHFD